MLGGGITRLERESFPAPLLCNIATMVEVENVADEGHIDIVLRLLKAEAGGESLLSEISFGADYGPNDVLSLDAPAAIPLAVEAANLGLPGPGRYHVAALLDGKEAARISFWAGLSPETPQA